MEINKTTTVRGRGRYQVGLVLIRRIAFNTFQRSETFNPKWSSKLLQATKEGQRARVSACLSHSADPDVAEADGSAALHYAVLRNSRAIVADLVKAGADINAVSERFGTALLLAILRNNLKIVRLLAESEVMKPLDKLGTALHAVAFVGNEKMLEVLGTYILSSDCRLGATIDVQKYVQIARRCSGTRAEHDQAVLEKVTPSRRIPSGVMVDAPGALRDIDSTGTTALMHAAQAAHKSSTQYLIDTGSFLNAVNSNTDTALSLALKGITEKHCEVATLLIEKGACCEWRSTNAETLLHLAARNDHRHALTALIEKCPPISAWNVTSSVSPSRVIGRQCSPAVDSGDIDSTNTEGQTALALAVRYDHEECVTSLLAADACVDLAKEETRPPVVQAAANGNALIVKKLLDKHANVLARTAGGETALHKAAERGHEGIARQLIDHVGHEKNRLLLSTNDAKQTALHVAALYRQVALVDILHHAGARPDVKDRNGNTVWDIARSQKDDVVGVVLRNHKARESQNRFDKLVALPRKTVKVEIVVRKRLWSLGGIF
ncbi:hypothetical protein AC578_3730 [Pseudocercospora eumusae]|uniref:Uncharacterized protein n=1 Tax=Pseudocercospora eumusae TaxID=321146 RepID=A0A139HST6_9PEZI|nr:hypothetical protein AC578_3730 [Pseudocercospora eumusae]